MKTLLISLILLCSVTILQAQNIQGIATYKTDRKMDLKMDSTKVKDIMKEQLKAQLKAQFKKEFTLQFDAQQSIYTEVEKLAPPMPSSGGISIQVSGGDELLYHNNKLNIYRNQTEIMGKQFLIDDTIASRKWILEKETKNIGNYTCFKATSTEEYESQSLDEKTMEFVATTKEKTIIVWYTLDIPIAHGPSFYRGVPGFILQVEDGDLTILCSKIVINPEKGINIEMPDKGKVVSQAEFDEIQEKKSAEMMERFKTSKSKKGNSGMEIFIGG